MELDDALALFAAFEREQVEYVLIGSSKIAATRERLRERFDLSEEP